MANSNGTTGNAGQRGEAGGEVLVAVERPPAGGYHVQEVPPGARLKLNFSTADVRIAALDVDLLLVFPDGGKIVLPGYALNMLGASGAEAVFLDRVMLSQDLLASISDVRLTDESSMRLVGNEAEANAQKKGEDEKKEEETPPPAPASPVMAQPSPNARFTGVADFSRPPEDPAEPGVRRRVEDPPPSGGGPPPNPNSHTGDGDGNVKAAELDIVLLGVSGNTVTPLAGGGQRILGGASVTEATTNPDFAVQQQMTTLTGTDHADIIYARNPERMPAGTYERLIDVTAHFPDEGMVANTATISNLPPGFAVNNATQVGDTWVINLDTLDPNHLQVELRYVLPLDGAHPDPNGFLSNFVLNILFSATDAAGGIHLYAGNQTFVTREISGPDDVEITSGDTTLYGLNATPPGTVINAGGGDDIVYAGPGHDVIDGGSGTNTISYSQSNGGVSVDLSAGTGHGAAAEGDTLTNFANIEGSRFADHLIGTAGDNIFIASEGGDNVIGNGGNDTADYAASSAGVSVNLVTGQGQGGLAEGDTLSGIANVLGSATGDNVLTGTSGANRLQGGAGNDVITGNGGADTLLAGAGNDTVTYAGAELVVEGGAGVDTLVMLAGANVDLVAADQTSADAGLVSGFENIEAGSVTTGMVVAGTTGDNRIITGSGADVIDGRGGVDTLNAGGGDDSVAYHGSETSIDGGTGANTLVVLAQASIDLSASDQTLGDDTQVSHFTNVDARALTAAQSASIHGNALANIILGGADDTLIDGAGGADTIITGAGNDRITYHGGESVIDGGGGTNTLILQAAVDVDLSATDQTAGDLARVANIRNVDASALLTGIALSGDAGVNTLTGGRGDDVIDGAGGADSIIAGAGDDTVTEHGTETRLDGGTGNDTLILATGATLTAVNLSAPSGADQTLGDSVTVTSFENLDAHVALGDLAVTGSLGANLITTGAGNDGVDGRGGADTISTGAGDDAVTYYGTETLIDGGTGTNTLLLRAGATLNLANTDQTSADLATVSGFTHVDGSTLGTLQAVTILGSAGANTLRSGAGADTIDGGGGADVISAGAGDDIVSLWGSEASIDGGSGANTLVLRAAINVDLTAADQSSGDAALVTGFAHIDASHLATGVSLLGDGNANTITGGAGADTIDGGAGADSVNAGGGNDTVAYHSGAASLDGGAGNNTLVVAGNPAFATLNFDAGFGVDQSAGDGVEVTNFSNLDAAGASAALTVFAGSSANVLDLGAGDDIIHGGGGFDAIHAGAGNDSVDYYGAESILDGGTGTNTLLLRAAGTIDLSTADQSLGDIATVTGFANVDASALAQGVTITGSGGANAITGGTGADVLDGNGGADTILAGAGADQVTARGTEALIDGQGGLDTLVLTGASTITGVDFSAAPGADQTSGDATLVRNFESLDGATLSAGVSVIGSTGANTLLTGAGVDIIDGRGGADIIDAGAGDDLVHFYGAEAQVAGGAGANTLVMHGNTAVNLALADQTSGDGANVSGFVHVDASGLGSAEGISITGSSAANSLTGGAGDDVLDGNGGADLLTGGAGDDTLTYRGTEASLDGGTGINTLALRALANVDLQAADQTAGDGVLATGFANVDASALGAGQAVTLLGSAGANTLTGGAGNDVLDGRGGADIISAGAGNDRVTFHGAEVTLDGGTGTNTLELAARGGITHLDFAAAPGADQSTGDAVNVANFQNLDAIALGVGENLNVTGTASANTLLLGAGDDVIHGNGGADSIDAGAGNDLVDLFGTEVSVAGGAGSNTLVMRGASTVNLGLADQTSGDTVNVTGFAHVDASALANGVSITGSAGANSLTGGAGDDVIDGAGGADTINAGAGDDSVVAHGTEVSIAGGSGNDTLVLQAGTLVSGVDFSLPAGADQTAGDATLLNRFEGVDASVMTAGITITGSAGANTLLAGSGDDIIHGGSGADFITAGAGNDQVDYWGSEATLDGGSGTNTLLMRASGTLNLSAGDQSSGDLAVVSGFVHVDASALTGTQVADITGSAGANLITGGAGADQLDGNGGADVISAGAGNDTVIYRGGETLVDGGTGADTLALVVAGGITAVDFSVAPGADQTLGDAGTATGFENLDASLLAGAITVSGGSGANTLLTGAGDDLIDGHGGADTIRAGAGNDTITYRGAESVIDGESGTNALVLASATDINLALADQSVGDATLVSNFTNVDASALGLTQGISLAGSSGANTLLGGAGADTIDGAGGADTIAAGAGDDTVSYRGAEVSLDGGAGTNTLLLRSAVNVNLGLGDQSTGDATATANFTNVSAAGLLTGVTLTGSAGANIITGGAGDDVLDGAGGADVVAAGAGSDSITWRGAEDTLDGGAGSDTLVILGSGGIAAVNLSVPTGADQSVGDSVMVTGFENIDASGFATTITVTGSTSANTIATGAGNDIIDGQGGADVINAGAGDDIVAVYGAEATISGGTGANTLVLGGAITINLGLADQTTGDAAAVSGFTHVDASWLGAGSGVSITGSGAANLISGGAGADIIDGAGGADIIDAGAGADAVIYRGAEVSIAGGAGNDTLTLLAGAGLTTINFNVSAGADQSVGDAVTVTDFENLDASALATALTVTGSSARNVLITGAGDDIIHGNGGSDSINAGAGNDSVDFFGSESALDGGAGANTLVLRAGASIDLAAADQSLGDAATVTGFVHVDGSLLSAVEQAALRGSGAANILIGGAGNDTLDGQGGADSLDGGAGADTLTYRGGESVIDGGTGTDTLLLAASATLTALNLNVAAGFDESVGDSVSVRNIENIDGTLVSTALSLTGSGAANTLLGGAGDDTIDGSGGADVIAGGAGNDAVLYYGGEAQIDGGTGTNSLTLRSSGGITEIDLSGLPGSDQTLGDNVIVTDFTHVDASILLASQGVTITGSSVANTLAGGAGADVIDGNGGADVIVAGAGADTVSYRGTEVSIDAGAGNDTLILRASGGTTAVDFSVAAGADQTSSDATLVTRFENLDATAMATGLVVTGTAGANTLAGGAGNDSFDGLGGTDTLSTGAGDDSAAYYGAEVLIDGGTGTNTLVLRNAATVNLASADQTLADAVTVNNFTHVDASGLSAAVSLTGSAGANTLAGGSNNDTIDGNGGADTINAGAGNDSVTARGGEAAIDGGAGQDTLVLAASSITAVDFSLGAGLDQTIGDAALVTQFENLDASALSTGLTITGSSAANTLLGSAGADSMDGNGGADIVQAGGGDDSVAYRGAEASLDGGAGADTLVLRVAVNTDLSASDQTVGDAVAVSSFQNVDASALGTAVNLLGSSADNVLIGGAGNDTLDGNGGADTLQAGAGNDFVHYRGGEAVVDGGTGTNTLLLDASASLDLSAADQSTSDATLVSGFQNVDASALSTAVSLTGSAAANVLTGGAGNDTLDGGGGADTLLGGNGSDTITFHGGEVQLDGGNGADTLVLAASGGITIVDLRAASGADQTAGDGTTVANFENLDASALAGGLTVYGSVSANHLTLGAGNDVIDGSGGADIIEAGTGNDSVTYRGTEASIDGGTGTNTLVLATATTIDLGASDSTLGDGVAVANFVNLDASALAGGITITGSAAANSILGGSGTDTIVGAGGADTLDAGAGNDTITAAGSEVSIDGGTGNDTLVLLAGTAVSALNLAAAPGTDQTTGDATTIANIEHLDAGAVTSALTLTGSTAGNVLTLGAGDDIIRGGGGTDTIFAGAGNDTVDYWGSEVSIDGGAGSNALILRAASVVDLAALDQTSGDAVAVTGFANVDGAALANALTLSGSAGANVIAGGSGDDTLDGRGGADVISANGGADVVTYHGSETSIDGGSGVDTLVLAASGGIAAINLGVAAGADQTSGDGVAVANFENLDASALSGALNVIGSAGANTLLLGAGDDIIHGGGGADTIDAGAGDDTLDYWGSESALDGGTGTNTLVLRAATTVDLAAGDQTLGDITTVSGMRHVDGSALTGLQSVVISGDAGASILTGGAGNDVIDGAGGADIIDGGAGQDSITWRGAEASLTGGAGVDTLVLAGASGITAIDFSVAAGSDQTSGDAVAVAGFENLDASTFTSALTVTGSGAANTLIAGAGDDVLDGQGGADIIAAGAGNDTVAYRGAEATLDGGSGINTLVLHAAATVDLAAGDQTTGDLSTVTGFANIDAGALAAGVTLLGAAGANTIAGSTGNDVIDGRGGADVINAGAGDDSVTWRAGATSLDGGAGTNTLVLASAVSVNLGLADQTGGDSVTVTNFADVDGSALGAALNLTGSAGANTLRSGSGNDVLDGAGGADTLEAGAGNDTVTARGAELSIDGGAGTDTLTLVAGSAVSAVNFAVSSGTDQTTGDATTIANFENLDASALLSALIVTGNASANGLILGAGDDVIHGGGGADVISTGAGNDAVDYWGAEVSVDGGTGTNTLVLRAASTVDLAAGDQTTGDAVAVSGFANVDGSALATGLTLTGSAAANTLLSGSGDDVVDGAGGADIIATGGGSDTLTYRGGEASIDAGSGTDTLVLAASGGTTAVDFSVAAGVDQTTGDGVAVASFENLDASALASALSLTGSASANILTTGSGDDVIHGGGGADVIVAGAGNDAVDYWASEVSIAGGTGTNTLVLRSAATVDLSAVDQTSGDITTVSGMLNVDGSLLGALQPVNVLGTTGVNSLTGGAGNDSLDGNGGADTLDGGGGNDTLIQRGAESMLDGGTGTDTLQLTATSGVTTVNFSVAAGADQTGGDTVAARNFENLNAAVLAGALTVTGSGGGNAITTGSGADTIDGNGGGDVISAGAGNDSVTYRGAEVAIDGGTGTNTLVLQAGVDINLSLTDQTSGDLSNVVNFQNVNAAAVATALQLYGSSGANAITGGSAADFIDGNAGADVISAGGGDDTVVYRATEASIDGGTGTNTLRLVTSGATVNLANADQTSGDSAAVTNFTHVDASLLTSVQSANITGSASANTITGGQGNDTLNGNGGADTVDGGSGNDTITSVGAETLVDGGAGTDTLVLLAASTVTAVNLTIGGADQTTGDTALVRNFDTVNASLMTTAITITGNSGGTTINGGSGNDVINGGGGADTLNGNGGNDTLSTFGTESVVDGGTGTNSLIVRAVSGLSAINLSVAAGSDQSTGDVTAVRNFHNVDASLVASGLTITGSSAANTITGGSAGDSINGNGGADVIASGGGNDTVTYQGAEVSIDGGSSFDTLTLAALGGITSVDFSVAAGADQTTGDSVAVSNFEVLNANAMNVALNVRGSTSTNYLYLGSGNDTIDGYGGADIITAGGGNDSVTYNGAEQSIDGGTGTNTLVMRAGATINLSGADQTVSDLVNVSNFTHVDASALLTGVSLTGSSAANTLTGGSGDDTLDGNGGADTLNGGGGNDALTYRGAEVAIDGGTGTNTLVLASAATVNLSNADQTSGDGVNVTNIHNIDAHLVTGSLSLTGSAGTNSIIGSGGDDTLDGAGGADVIAAGLGNDTVTGRGAEVSLDGGAGTDTLVLTAAGGLTAITLGAGDQTTGDAVGVTGFESINAGVATAALTITGTAAANALTSGSGDDVIDGAGGADSINAGGGNDTVTYRGAESAIDGGTGTNTLVLASATFVNLANADQTTGDAVNVSGFVHVDASGLAAAVTLTGSGAANTLAGGSGNDVIDGAGGTDSLSGGGGNDTLTLRGTETTLDGGTGLDTLVLAAGASVVAVNLSLTGGADQTSGDAVLAGNFESLDASGFAGALTITGSASANSISSGAGADTINGQGGTDTINAGGGNDTVTYNGTELSIDGGTGTNTLVLASAATVDLNAGDQTSGDGVNVSNFNNIDASGLGTGVTLVGTASNNTLTGGAGNDIIDGGGGVDAINAGGGNDSVTYRGIESSVDGGTGTNTLVLASAATVNLGLADQTSGDSVNVTNFAHVDASGLGTGVSLTGNAGANTLSGGSGDDTLNGNGGADQLNGNGGNDTFLIDVSSLPLGLQADGGTGTNSISFTGSGTVSDAQLLAALTNMQDLDFTAAGVDAALNLTGAQIAQLDGGAANTLTLHINAGDSVNLNENPANYDVAVVGATTTYTIYDDAAHTNLVAHLAVVA